MRHFLLFLLPFLFILLFVLLFLLLPFPLELLFPLSSLLITLRISIIILENSQSQLLINSMAKELTIFLELSSRIIDHNVF